MEEITLGALLITAVGVMVQLARQEVPKFLGSARESKRSEIAAAEQRIVEERQDDKATFANMVSLQTRMATQNERLMEYFIIDFREDIVELKKLMGSLEGRIIKETEDIEKRWLTSSLELKQVSGQQRIITTEVVRLTDKISDFESRLVYALSCIPELMGDDVAN